MQMEGGKNDMLEKEREREREGERERDRVPHCKATTCFPKDCVGPLVSG